jgi:hypothetical protein
MPEPINCNLNWAENVDNYEDVTFYHGTTLRCPSVVSATPTTLNIIPLGVSMTSGQKLKVGLCTDFTLSANLGATDDVAQVTSVKSIWPAETPIYGPAVDVSGWTLDAKLTNGTTTWTVTATAISGKIRLFLPSTVDVPFNCTDREIAKKKLDGFELQDINTWGSLLSKAYRWYVNATDVSGLKLRRMQGYALVTKEGL